MRQLFTLLWLGSALCSAAETPELPNEKLSDLTFDAQYRGRYERYSGLNKKAYGNDAVDAKGTVRGQSDDTIYLQQIIAGLSYRPSAQWEYRLSFYDARSWGSSLTSDDFLVNTGSSDEYMMHFYDDHLELFTSYLRKKSFLTPELTLTLGRLQLGYGDRRIFGPGKWGNTMGWLWDAAHLSLREGKAFLDLWYGQTRVKYTDDFSIIEKHRYQGVGLYGHHEEGSLRIEPFAAWRNALHHETFPYQNHYWGGLRLYDDAPGFIYDLTFAKAFGTTGSKRLDAYGYVLKGGYLFSMSMKPRVSAGYVYASGDEDPADERVGSFETPFGANDGMHYGRMDVMFWKNMRDTQLSVNFTPLPKLNVEAAYHRFHLASAADKWYHYGYKNLPLNSYTHVGDEYDLVVKYKAAASLELLAIGTYLKAGDFIRKNNIAENDASKLFLQFVYKYKSR